MTLCPICQACEMHPTDTKVTMPDILRQWEGALGQPLARKVWEDYKNIGDEDVGLFTCTSCGFGQFQPVLAGTESFYEAISAVDYYNAEKWEFDVAALDLIAAGARSVLDVGCGSGIFLDSLKKRMPEATLWGYDLNAGLLDQLEARGFSVLRSLPSTGGETTDQPQFDAICMLQVLEHVADPVGFFRTFLPLLRPGGLVIITTPNSEGPIRFFQRSLTEVPPHHTTRWTERSFRKLFSTNDCSVKSVRFEPLPDYLWDSYLPVIWDEPIWPARVFDPLARERGRVSVCERSGFAAEAMKSAGIRWLHGVVGHTIYVSANRTME